MGDKGSQVRQTYSGSQDGYWIRAWDYEHGWLVGLSFGGGSEKGIWADSATSFHAVPVTLLIRQKTIQIEPNPMELSEEERKVVLDMLWD